MRLWLRLLLTFLVPLAVAAGAWVYVNWQTLAWQLACYRVGAAQSSSEAAAELAFFETEPDRSGKLAVLMDKWGTGNQQFDLYLAQYVGSSQSSEALREAFSRHEDLLPRWAHFWLWKTSQPDAEIRLTVAYFNVAEAADAPRSITWREVLNLQAIFQLTGQPKLARRLTPGIWRERYQRWRADAPDPLPTIPRPEKPFADWKGPVPPR